jgi:hypothetical protein
MAITFDAGTAMVNDVSAGSFTFSKTNNAGSDTFLRATAGWVEATVSPTSSPSGVTYNGVALTVIPSSKVHIALGDSTNSLGIEQWGLVAPATGANNLAFTFTGNVIFRGGAESWFGVDQTTPYGTAAIGNAADTTPSINVASADNGVAVSSALVISLTALVSGDTERWNNAPVSNSAAGGSSQLGAASVTMDWSGAFGAPYNWVESGVSLHPTPAYIDPTLLLA